MADSSPAPPAPACCAIHVAPGWDPTAELTRGRAVGRWRRWRRQPGFLRVLVRVAPLRRMRHG